MANHDIFGIPSNPKKRRLQRDMLAENAIYGSGVRPREAVGMFGLERDEEFEEQERLHDQPSGPEPEVTPDEREEAKRVVKESLDRIREAQRKKKEE